MIPPAIHAFEQLEVLSHPVIQAKLSILRDKTTPSYQFRRVLYEIAGIMSAVIFAHIHIEPVKITTPLEETDGARLADPVPCIVSILRAGNGLADALLAILPEAAIGHLGLQRDPVTHEPVYYYEKLPTQIEKRQIIMTDPMLATGGSAIMAADRLKSHGASDIRFACLVAAPEGVSAFCKAHPDIPITTAALDRKLDENRYILPGLGDAGDRIYNTLTISG